LVIAPLRYRRRDPSHDIRWLGNSGLLAKYLSLCAKPIFEIVAVFTASVPVEPIRTGTDYIPGQFKRASLGFAVDVVSQTACITDDVRNISSPALLSSARD
jgi:hypothetical protein